MASLRGEFALRSGNKGAGFRKYVYEDKRQYVSVHLPAFEPKRIAVCIRHGCHVIILKEHFPLENHVVSMLGGQGGSGLAERRENRVEVSRRRGGFLVSVVITVDHFPEQLLGVLNHGEILVGIGIDETIHKVAVCNVIWQKVRLSLFAASHHLAEERRRTGDCVVAVAIGPAVKLEKIADEGGVRDSSSLTSQAVPLNLRTQQVL